MKKQTKCRARFSCVAVFLSLTLLMSSCVILPTPEPLPPGERSAKERQTPDTLGEEDFAEFLDTLFLDEMGSDFLTAKFSLRDPEGFGVDLGEPSLGEFSLDAMRESTAENRALRADLEQYDYGALNEEQQLIYDLLEDWLEGDLMSDGLELLAEYNSPNGSQYSLPQLLMEYSLQSEEDVEDYLLLLRDFPRYLDDMLAFQREKSEAGYFMAPQTLDQTLEVGREFATEEGSAFMLTSFETRLSALDALSQEQREAYLAENREIFETEVLPAYQSFLAELEKLRGTNKNEQGLAYFDKGKEFYNYLLRASLGTSRSAEELATLLDAQLEAAFYKMGEIVSTNPTAAETAWALMDSAPEPSDPALILRQQEQALTALFPPLTEPVAYSVDDFPASMEGGSVAAYYVVPPIDAPSENHIYVNRKESAQTFDFYQTLAHEGFPGHLYQTNYFMQQNPHPIRYVLESLGTSEGWATYVSQLSFQLYGVEDGEVLQCLQAYSALSWLFYARADIGIHYEGWSRAKLGEFVTYWGFGSDPTLAEELFNGILSDPGSYLPYGAGLAELLELRRLTEERLGERFDERAFHKVLLDVGNVPFSILREKVEAHILEQGGEAVSPDGPPKDTSERVRQWAA